MASSKHRCSKSDAREDHSVRGLFDPSHGHGRHFVDGQRCLCHGHCGLCEQPAIQCKLGRFHHKADY